MNYGKDKKKITPSFVFMLQNMIILGKKLETSRLYWWLTIFNTGTWEKPNPKPSPLFYFRHTEDTLSC